MLGECLVGIGEQEIGQRDVCAVLVVIANKGLVSNVTLCLLYSWTTHMGWLMHFFGAFNWFQRMMIQVQRVFNLQQAPQEQLEGSDNSVADASWPQ